LIYHGICRFILQIGAVVLLQAQVRGQVADEYHVKAAYLYNFAKFVEWPSQVFKSATDPIAICVLGTDLFGESLDQTVNGKSLAGRPLTVRHIGDSQQAGACQILFVSSSERKRLAAIFSIHRRV
jgi:YfiR/HmsC-like